MMSLVSIFYILTILSALFGLWITVRIYCEKRSEKPMVCPMGASCETVVRSEFSSFLGIGLELYGAMYYGLIAISYTFFLVLLPQTLPDIVGFIISGFSIVAFFFSLYLTFVQAFYLKSWCTWCLFSALASTLIFVFVSIGLAVSDFELIPILESLSHPILIMHILGFILGVGGSTISDILFMKFLKDFKISPMEDKILKTMSQIIWFGLLIIVISGVGLYLPQAEVLNSSSKFLAKMVIVGVILLNGSLLNLIISPKLVKISCSQCLDIRHTHKLRQLAFILGSISFVSWYSALILGTMKSVPLSFTEIITIYALAVSCAMLGSQILEGILSNKMMRSTK